MVAQPCEYAKNCCSTHFKWVNCMLWELYLDISPLQTKNNRRLPILSVPFKRQVTSWSKIAPWTLLILGCLRRKVCFWQGHRARKHFTLWEEGGGERVHSSPSSSAPGHWPNPLGASAPPSYTKGVSQASSEHPSGWNILHIWDSLFRMRFMVRDAAI